MHGINGRDLGKFILFLLVSMTYGFRSNGRVNAGRPLTRNFAVHSYGLKVLLKPIGETYSLRKVTKWLIETGTLKSDYEPVSSPMSVSIYNSGMRLKLNEELKLSIQTDPTTAGGSFCETGLMKEGRLLRDNWFGYGDTVCRWDEPEDLFQHIVEVRQKLKDKHDEQAIDESTRTFE